VRKFVKTSLMSATWQRSETKRKKVNWRSFGRQTGWKVFAASDTADENGFAKDPSDYKWYLSGESR